jgi:hypothetical protein
MLSNCYPVKSRLIVLVVSLKECDSKNLYECFPAPVFSLLPVLANIKYGTIGWVAVVFCHPPECAFVALFSNS